jgi:Zn-finger nucleic acid-binding protein
MDVVGRLLNMFISREREYRADAAAVRLTRNPISLASALYRIGTRWRGAGYGGEHISPIFILSPRLGRLDEEEGLIATMFSTHPPLLRRLRTILGLAHADLTDVTDRLRKERRRKQEKAADKAAANVIARRGADWVGPFTLLQLQTLDWLTAKTELRIGGGEEIVAANRIPVLNHFFQRRNEPFWRMKRSCPVCRKQLVVEEYEGLHVWRCAFCDGMLAEQHKLPRIFVREEKTFTEDVQRAAVWLKEGMSRKNRDFRLLVDISQARPCARCGRPMIRKFYSYAYHVEIDQCRTCKLVWFDADELEILQCLIEREKRKENRV